LQAQQNLATDTKALAIDVDGTAAEQAQHRVREPEHGTYGVRRRL
jgi:hypothetical protein